jgi:DNA-directed RNA polymerase specialized sigma24 family protein
VAARRPFKLTRDSFDRLLACLDEDRERAAAKYETLRSGLIRFFEWRGCLHAQDHADEVIDRVARRLEEGAPVTTVPNYAAGVARLVFLEILRAREREKAALREMPAPEPVATEDERLKCVRRCLGRLPAEGARLLIAYYEDGQGGKAEVRKRLAEELGASPTAFRMKLRRLRVKLEECMAECLRNPERDKSGPGSTHE